MTGRKLTTTGAAVAAWGDSVELVESIYEATEGEVDAGTEAAERRSEALGSMALEELARFDLFQDDATAALDREVERIAAARIAIASRKAWALEKILAILGNRKRVRAGPFTVNPTLGRKRVVARQGLDLSTLPESLVRVTPPQITDEVRALDKKAAAKWIENPDNLPISGVTIERGPTKVKIS